MKVWVHLRTQQGKVLFCFKECSAFSNKVKEGYCKQFFIRATTTTTTTKSRKKRRKNLSIWSRNIRNVFSGVIKWQVEKGFKAAFPFLYYENTNHMKMSSGFSTTNFRKVLCSLHQEHKSCVTNHLFHKHFLLFAYFNLAFLWKQRMVIHDCESTLKEN